MNLSEKRSASLLPCELDVPRIRTTDAKKLSAVSASLNQGPPQHGQEVLSLSPSLTQEQDRKQNINDLILQTTLRLASEGKRLTRAPRLLTDGIAFDWIYDIAAQDADIKTLLSVEGINFEDLQKVLLRATPASSHPSRAATEEPSNVARPRRNWKSIVPTPPPWRTLNSVGWFHRRHVGNASESDAVVIDDKEVDVRNGGRRRTTTPSGVLFLAPEVILSRRRSTPDLVHPTTSSFRTHAHARIVESHDELEAPFPLAETLNSDRPKVLFQPTWSDDRSSVVSYATRHPESPARENVIQDEDHCIVDTTVAENSVDVISIHPRDSSRFRNPPNTVNTQPQSDLGKRKADYGEWKSFAEDSSDVDSEMDPDPDRPSSGESYLTTTSHPQPPTRAVPGLPFLPKTYDTSGLLSQEAFALAPGPSRSGPGVKGNSSYHECNRSSSRRVPELPGRSSYQPVNRPPEYSSVSAVTDGLPIRPLSRQKPVSAVQSSPRGSSQDCSDIVIDSRKKDKVQKPTVPLPRSNTNSQSLRRDRSSGSTLAYHPGRSLSYSHLQSRSARRSAAASGQRFASNSEDDVDHRRSPRTPKEVVIPKAEYARGRRLLVPTNQECLLTTVLMRGEAHFIDQRRKTRVSRYSLPVEDNTRHVEDACLLGDNIVVVGYNRGPYQASLIPVQVDQRPCRIDLSFKAHSTVIEKRSIGKSSPNQGIACLAPVSDCSFLSGGHDRSVYRWSLACIDDRQVDSGYYSVTAARIPTEHTQAVRALAYAAWNDTVYSAAGDRIATTKVAALMHSLPERVSGKVAQVHVHPQDPRLIALEVDHLDYQVQFFDMREGGFARRPWLEFGYRPAPPRANHTSGGTGATPLASASTSASARLSTSTSRPANSHSTPKLGSRYTRGSTTNSLFARGYGDGVVLVWDYRNGAQKKVLERFQFRRPDEVAHTVLAGSDVIAYGGYSVTFWSMLSATD